MAGLALAAFCLCVSWTKRRHVAYASADEALPRTRPAVYAALKDYGCCTLLNFIGSLWAALLVLGVFGWALCVVGLVSIGALDMLPSIG